MMNNIRCAYTLMNFSIDQAIDPAWSWPPTDPDQVTVLTNSVPIQAQWIDYCRTAWHIEFDHTLCFIRPQRLDDPWCHVDIDTQNPEQLAPMTAINWVYGGANSKMLWWDTKNIPPIQNSYVDHTGVHTAYRIWQTKLCEQVDEFTITTEPVLTRICIPHSVRTEEPRWSVSVRFRKIGRSWADAVNHFRTRGAINDTAHSTDHSSSSYLDNTTE